MGYPHGGRLDPRFARRYRGVFRRDPLRRLARGRNRPVVDALLHGRHKSLFSYDADRVDGQLRRHPAIDPMPTSDPGRQRPQAAREADGVAEGTLDPATHRVQRPAEGRRPQGDAPQAVRAHAAVAGAGVGPPVIDHQLVAGAGRRVEQRARVVVAVGYQVPPGRRVRMLLPSRLAAPAGRRAPQAAGTGWPAQIASSYSPGRITSEAGRGTHLEKHRKFPKSKAGLGRCQRRV